MEKKCSICRAKFIPTNERAETRQCCKECRNFFTQSSHYINGLVFTPKVMKIDPSLLFG